VIRRLPRSPHFVDCQPNPGAYMSNNSKPSSAAPLGSTDLARWHLLPAPGEDQAVWTYDSSPDKTLGEQSFPSK